MPQYAFSCQTCNLRFSRTLKMGEHPTHTCPTCKDTAPRVFQGEAFGFAFQNNPTGTDQANTGVHDHDYPTADKMIGRSAESRWATYRERDKVKKQVRKAGGESALVRVDGQGYTEYDAMTPQSKKAREKVVDLAVQVEREKADKSGR